MAEQRFEKLGAAFAKQFGDVDDASFFTAPGRTEIIGNHTDHNGGKVIAASISLDTIGIAKKSDDNKITIASEGYPVFSIDLEVPENEEKDNGTSSLIAGMVVCARKRGYKVEGFQLAASTTVIPAAGVSSSASFEMLVATVINEFFNDGKMSYAEYAIIGQYGENEFWHKSSGRMDQMACAVGGPIVLDFADEIQYEKIPFGFDEYGYSMVITNTGKGHADLSADYSAVPNEMFAVAKALGKEKLCQTDMDALLAELPRIKEEVKNDRAILRAMHFLNETKRVSEMEGKVAQKDIESILKLISASGRSSYDLLQNCYLTSDTTEQPIALALALTEQFLAKIGKGVCRVHGGGFAGVIQAIIPEENAEEYVKYMEGYFGAGNVYPMDIRQTGAVCLK